MVDAKAPALANILGAALQYDCSTNEGRRQYLKHLSRLYLIASAFENREQLAPAWQSEIARLVGIPTPKEEVLATAMVAQGGKDVAPETVLVLADIPYVVSNGTNHKYFCYRVARAEFGAYMLFVPSNAQAAATMAERPLPVGTVLQAKVYPYPGVPQVPRILLEERMLVAKAEPVEVSSDFLVEEEADQEAAREESMSFASSPPRTLSAADEAGIEQALQGVGAKAAEPQSQAWWRELKGVAGLAPAVEGMSQYLAQNPFADFYPVIIEQANFAQQGRPRTGTWYLCDREGRARLLSGRKEALHDQVVTCLMHTGGAPFTAIVLLNDVDTIGQALNSNLSSIVTCVTMVVGALVMMFVNSWQLTLITLASTPLSLILVLLIVKFSQKYFVKQQNSLGEINGIIEENYSAHNIVKTFNAEDKAQQDFEKVNKVLYSSGFKSQFFSGILYPVMNFITNLVYVLVCVVGGIISIKTPIFAITIVAFVEYMRIFNQQIGSLAQISGTVQGAVAASERVFEFLDEEEQAKEDEKTAKITNVKGLVEFKNVCFGYDKDKEIIHNFSAKILPGQKVAIVGPTGAGKTTMVNLLMRFYDINSGDITIDGVSIYDMKREDVRALFGMVLQDTWIFDGTIRENIAYGSEGKTNEEIEKACSFAHIDHFIRSLPGGYDMMLDETANISQGQRQLLTIARAMVNNAPMLILDEATSSVDTRTEIQIQKAMDKLTEGRTSFVIAHRLSTIQNADQILVMKDGNIVEQGTHEQLLQKNGFYAELYKSGTQV